MFSQYVDLILLIAAVIQVLTVLLIVLLLHKINKIERTNKTRKFKEVNIIKENIGWRATIPKTIRLGEANAKDIKTLSDQQQLLNRFVGEVLNVSNLIPNKELGIEVSDIIEELRERVKWAEELEKYQADDSDFYKGD